MHVNGVRSKSEGATGVRDIILANGSRSTPEVPLMYQVSMRVTVLVQWQKLGTFREAPKRLWVPLVANARLFVSSKVCALADW